MALYTKCIYSERKPEDGLRISVMSRHTLNDGITPDPKITDDKFDIHFKILGPPLKLIGDYYKRGLSWEDFEKEYLDYIRMPGIAKEVQGLAKLALERDITLLCVEENAEKCHRRIISLECKRYEPELEVRHL